MPNRIFSVLVPNNVNDVIDYMCRNRDVYGFPGLQACNPAVCGQLADMQLVDWSNRWQQTRPAKLSAVQLVRRFVDALSAF